MTRPRGRPAQGSGVARDAILAAALALLEEGNGSGLTMRGLAARLGVTPMSLYHHVADRTALLVALSDLVYGEVMPGPEPDATGMAAGPHEKCRAELRALLVRYHDAVARHPQLTLAIFAEPAAFAGVTRRITERLDTLLATLTPAHLLWRDVLVDHAHGSGLALAAARGDAQAAAAMREQYGRALDCLLAGAAGPAAE
ncbi:TetR/AcrR family transcriptional regulator [Pseudoduganella sp. SL102]|uniref:TetR/AcrR family transcriptional regulator n=1 Tax=Pseudoduganella sp. SL102 TaxID=2995154 RepID=UPI00248B6CAD|nr:TetR/AcrR family transcriptional regulator [Pseudoduganella sp. SL102]WBS00987.1 TetR/AcrR family transcriptional regulator [Pseudoduganella sp. SL102]